MNVSRLFLVVLLFSFSTIESALAFCPNPLPPGIYCCGFDDTIGLPAFLNSEGLLIGEARADDRIPNDEQAYSQEGCRSESRLPFIRLFVGSGCPSNPALPPITAVEPAFTLPGPNGSVIGRENYTVTYRAYTPYPGPNGTALPGTCLVLHGHTTWLVSPPPPPPVACSIPDLPPIPETADACTKSLEANRGLPGPNSGCPPVPVMTTESGEPCWRRKVNEAGALYVEPDSTIRTAVYNRHLIEVWKSYERHMAVQRNTEQYQACAARRAVVEAEMSKHGLAYPPADNSRHLTGRAFDDGSVKFKLALGYNPMRMLRSSTTIPDSPACTLIWGGSWDEPDYVHFELTGP